MGYERDEAMRQQDATEAMIRMREPKAPSRGWNETIQSDEFKALSRPSDGPFMPCPAKVAPISPNWRVQFTSEIVMPRDIPNGVMEPGLTGAIRATECAITEAGRIHRLSIEGPNNAMIDFALEVDKHGSQVGNFNLIGPDGGVNIPSEVRMVMGLFLCLDFAGIAHLVKVEAVSG